MPRARKIRAPQASPENRATTLQEASEDEKDSPAHKRAIDRAEARQTLISLADQVAEDTMFIRNYMWPTARQEYPIDADAGMRFVSRYYPYAKPRPLYVDEPRSFIGVQRCEEKRKIMKKLGLRYVVLAAAYQDPDGHQVKETRLEDALEQLER